MTRACAPLDARRRVIVIAIMAVSAAGCQQPRNKQAQTAVEIEAILQAHPEVLYRVIDAHPAEFVDVLTRAAQKSEQVRRAQRAAEEKERIEEDRRDPKRPEIGGRIVFGNLDAPVTIVEYTDFECPYCRQETTILSQLFQKYGDRIRLIVKQFPIADIHPNAVAAARMYEAVAHQSPAKGLAYYEAVYTDQPRLSRDGLRFLDEIAHRIGADVSDAHREAGTDWVTRRIKADQDEAIRFGFNGTPSFVVNGIRLSGVQSVQAFGAVIDHELAPSAIVRVP